MTSRNPPVGDLALLDQLFHRLGHLFRFDLRVDAVLVIEVDVVGLELFQAPFDRFADGLPAGIHLEVIAHMPDPAFGREHNFIPVGLQRRPHQFFVISGAAVRVYAGIALGGVKKGVPHIDRLRQQFGHLPHIRRCAGGVGHPHAAEADRRYRQVSAQYPCLHMVSPLSVCRFSAGADGPVFFSNSYCKRFAPGFQSGFPGLRISFAYPELPDESAPGASSRCRIPANSST